MDKIIKSPEKRRYLYVVGVAVAALLVGYGIINAEHSGLWVSLLGTVLGFSQITSAANVPERPTEEDKEDEVPVSDDVA